MPSSRERLPEGTRVRVVETTHPYLTVGEEGTIHWCGDHARYPNIHTGEWSQGGAGASVQLTPGRDKVKTVPMKLHHIDNLNCHKAHVRAGQPGDELHYGWALGPGEVRYQHCWLVRNGELIDLFNWTDHEDLGVRLVIGRPNVETAAE